MSNVQSTRAQRKQWQNLMTFNTKKNKKELGKGETYVAGKGLDNIANFTRINKSAPVS